MTNQEEYNGTWGRDLKPGDTIKVWWSPKGGRPRMDTIARIDEPHKSYDGFAPNMDRIWPDGYRFAYFTSGMSMTISNKHDLYSVVL